MSTENALIDPYDAVLADLRSKLGQIEQAIAAIEGLRSNGPVSSAPRAAETGIVETAGMFLGMSIVDASKKLLAMRKQTLGNVEIARAIQAGGLKLTAADPVNVVGSVLTRRFNQVGDIVKVGRGIWGLKEWYPGRNFKPSGTRSSAVPPQEASEEIPIESSKEESDSSFGHDVLG